MAAQAQTTATLPAQNSERFTLTELKEQYSNYVSVKFNEIEEQRDSWRFYHGAQWTNAELQILKDRKQPAITFNRTARKINGLVGIIQKLRSDPKAFPRGPSADADAEVCTICLREVCDSSRMEDIEPKLLLDGSVHGYAVAELGLEKGDNGDPEVTVSQVDAKTFFYDPRSLAYDFSDVRFLGVSKWVDLDELDEIKPGASDKVKEIGMSGPEWTMHDTDRAPLWINAKKQIRLNEHWYKWKGDWYYCIYVGSTKLTGGKSPFVDEKGRSIHRYIAFTCGIDQDGDRYGFVRLLKGPQLALNQHRSKAMWIMNTRQILADHTAFADIEATRREAARPDGVIIKTKGSDASIETADQEFLQQTEYFKESLGEIENFGPNPALVGTGVEARSGRAFAMMQQSGLAELGPFIGNWKAFKLKLYRYIWQAIRKHWKAERWVRVTDDPKAIKFVALNKPKIVPLQPGMPPMGNGQVYGNDMPGMQPFQVMMENNVSALDVDIIIEEGPDTANTMGDTFDLMLSLAQNGMAVPPEVIVEISALPHSMKQKLMTMFNQPPSPEKQEAMKLELDEAKAKIEKLIAETEKLRATTEKTAGVDTAKTRAETAKTRAGTVETFAKVDKTASDIAATGAQQDREDFGSHMNGALQLKELSTPPEPSSIQ